MFSGVLSTTKTVAKSFIRLYRDKKLHGASEHRFIQALAHVADLWMKEFMRVRQDLSERFLLPQHVYLLASRPLDSLILENLPTSGTDAYGQYQLTHVIIENFWPIEAVDPSALTPLASLLMTYTLTHPVEY